MIGETWRHRQAKQELREFRDGPMPTTPFVKRPWPEDEVNTQCSIERRCAEYTLPYEFVHQKPALHPAQRDISERVIDEVQGHIREQY